MEIGFDYRNLDPVGRELLRLYPDAFGLAPQDRETYIALAVRDYFMVLEQEQRLTVLRELIAPQRINVEVNQDYSTVKVKLTEAEVNRPLLGMIASYAVQMALQEMEKQNREIVIEDNPRVDIGSAVGLRLAASGMLRIAYDGFEPGDMSPWLEAFLRRLYEIVVVGAE